MNPFETCFPLPPEQEVVGSSPAVRTSPSSHDPQSGYALHERRYVRF